MPLALVQASNSEALFSHLEAVCGLAKSPENPAVLVQAGQPVAILRAGGPAAALAAFSVTDVAVAISVCASKGGSCVLPRSACAEGGYHAILRSPEGAYYRVHGPT